MLTSDKPKVANLPRRARKPKPKDDGLDPVVLSAIEERGTPAELLRIAMRALASVGVASLVGAGIRRLLQRRSR